MGQTTSWVANIHHPIFEDRRPRCTTAGSAGVKYRCIRDIRRLKTLLRLPLLNKIPVSFTESELRRKIVIVSHEIHICFKY